MSGDDIIAKFNAYWLALGQFVDAFSNIEAATQTLLWEVANTPQETARAVFSGVKTDTAISFVRRLFDSKGQQLPPMLDRAFQQLAAINTFRNELLHHGATFDGQDLVVTNRLLALPGREKATPVSPEILASLCFDLGTLQYCFALFLRERQVGALNQIELDALRVRAQLPWRYKPPAQQPVRSTKPPRSNTKAPRRQPPPSQD